MALHPANPGHMFVIPNEHVVTINNLPELSAHLFFISMRLAHTLSRALSSSVE